MRHYDYIFAGSGLSALMTVYRMAVSGKFDHKTILLVDCDSKKKNDRTWCFWEKPQGEWDHLVYKKWESAIFADNENKRTFSLAPLQYKMIRGIDFYTFVQKILETKSNITFLNETVTGFNESEGIIHLNTENHAFSCTKLFNSIFNPLLALSQNKYPFLQQHFVGWFIKSAQPVFDRQLATFMDFSIEQKGNTRFMYVLPFSENEALIEYTLFSKTLLPQSEYEQAIQSYLTNLGISDFEIIEKEHGSIPMTVYPFWKQNTKNVIHIGSAGGWTKASTGYTFKKTIKESAALVSFLMRQDDLTKFHKINRFHFYDMLLLDILAKQNEKGIQIFSALFKDGNPNLIFSFLDEKTSISQDLSVILKCPKGLFLSALIQRIFA